jgi:hypothetical protein
LLKYENRHLHLHLQQPGIHRPKLSDPAMKDLNCNESAEAGFAEAHGSATWCPMLRTGDLQISLYADETLEIRDGQAIYAHLTPSETADFLRWIDARAKSPNAGTQRPGAKT